MHNSHQSFAARQRLLNYDGNASNQLIWFTAVPEPGRRGEVRPDAEGAARARPVAEEHRDIRIRCGGQQAGRCVDSCFDVDGNLIARGPGVWGGMLDGGPKGTCAQAFPPFGTSRTVAGGPIGGGIFKCELQTTRRALTPARTGRGSRPTAELDRLNAIFPTGVCDYSKGDAGRPQELALAVKGLWAAALRRRPPESRL